MIYTVIIRNIVQPAYTHEDFAKNLYKHRMIYKCVYSCINPHYETKVFNT